MTMRYYYFAARERCRRWNGSGDVRGYCPRPGWKAWAAVLDIHPISGNPLKHSEWWIFERRCHARN